MTISETILWIKIMNNLNYPLRVSKNKPTSVFFEKINDKKKKKKKNIYISKIILCFVSTLEKHLQSNQFQDLFFFEIRHIKTKYVYFLFRLNFDFGFFIKPWRNRLYLLNVARKSGFRLQFLRQSAFQTHHCWRGQMTSPIISWLVK